MDDFLYKVQTRFLFHAHIRIKIPAACDDALFDALFQIMEEVDRKYNSYHAGSYIDQINSHAGSFVAVDDETIFLLKTAVSFSDFFKGAYDITIMPLIRLWGFYSGETKGRIPTGKELKAVMPFINYHGIEWAGNAARVQKGQEIVTGSFIKAYAVDKLVSKMRQAGIDDGIINAGGSTIYAFSPSGDSWDIAVADPFCDKGYYAFSLKNLCLSTSSQSETFVTVDGKRFGHILDPRTGFPARNRLVCVMCENCMVGDMISTGLINETPSHFLQTVGCLHKQYGIEGFLIDGEGNVFASPGFRYRYEKTA